MDRRDANQATQSNIILLLIILAISCLGQMLSDLYLPSLPTMAKKLQVPTNWVQFTLAIYMIAFSVSQLFYGPISDALGRRKPILFGLSLSLSGSLLCTFSPDIYTLYVGRALQGLGAGAGISLVRPILRDLFETEQLAVYNTYIAIASVFILSTSPILGGYIDQLAGWRFNFGLLTLLTIMCIALFYFKVPETSQHHHKDNLKLKTMLNNASILLKSPVFIRFTVCPFLTYGGILAWLTATPIIMQEVVGLSPVEFGWLYIFSGAGFLTGGLLNMRLVAKVGIDRMVNLGFMAQLLAGLLMLVGFLTGYINVPVIMLPVLLFMLGSSLVFPNSSAGALIPFPKIAGTAGAIYGFIQILGGAISSSLMSLLEDQNQLPIAIAFIACSIISIMVFNLLKKP
jgi:Bcr/CflA subfamily drug resistance transporter